MQLMTHWRAALQSRIKEALRSHITLKYRYVPASYVTLDDSFVTVSRISSGVDLVMSYMPSDTDYLNCVHLKSLVTEGMIQ